MILAFSTDDDGGLEGVLSYHFGRCPYYTFVDVEGAEIKDVRAVPNPFYEDHGEPGQVPSFIRSQAAQVIIAGGMGPRAISFFQQFGIEAITGASGRVKDAVELYLKGSLAGAEPCNESPNRVSPGPGKIPLPGGFEGGETSRLQEEVGASRRQLAEAQKRLAMLEQKKK